MALLDAQILREQGHLRVFVGFVGKFGEVLRAVEPKAEV
jgi:hypothetical protein